MSTDAKLVKRIWHYLQLPAVYEIAPCDCGNTETQWSEYAGHLWCEKCQKDFIPAHNGIFDGPIAARAALLLGIAFDRYNLETGCIERFDLETGTYCTAEEGMAPGNSAVEKTHGG